MNAVERCPECGGRLKAGSGDGLCARCLLAAALRHPAATASDSPPVTGEQIGSYRLIRLLGEGGMGMVYLAEQEQPIIRHVALKIIKLGMDTRAVLARFASEQQALARMDHPNIAQVYEAGSSAQGRPYFVMEYVPGVPITEYCDRHRLDTRRRLELFVQVADAVQHAHQKGVIHRDLKPSNVLVMERDGESVPKIIDFGLAKATEKNLTEETLFTETGVLIGTPEYMSPEQASPGGTDVDTRTDIYSLGVLLYELLVGAVPFDSHALRAAGYDEIRRVIRETDPPKPATRLDSLGPEAVQIASHRATDARGLRRELCGDLEWITLKTLEKDRSRRYASASDLAEDIRRRLAGEPVVAAPPDVLYRLRKFAARHVPQLAAAAVVILALLAGLALSTAYYLHSEYERESIERRNYTADLAAAERLVNLNQPEPARELLLACSPEMRNWEWRHLWARSESGAAGVLRKFPQPIAAMAAAARSGAVAVGFETGEVEIVAPEGTVAQHWQAHAGGVRALALAPDGKLLVTTSSDSGLRFWDVPANRLMAELPLPAPATSLAYGPGGRTIAAGLADGTAMAWRADSRALVTTIRANQRLDAVAIVPNGSALATTGSGSVRLWNAPKGDLRLIYPDSGFVAFSRYGEWAVTATPGKGEARVWNARVNQLRGVLDTGAEVVSAAFKPGSNRIVVATRQGALEVWNNIYFDHIATLHAEPGIRAILFAGSDDRLLGLYQNEVRTWDTRTTRPAPKAQAGRLPSLWGTFWAMLGGGVFVLLIAGALCAALFRRQRVLAAMDRFSVRIPVLPVPWGLAQGARWVARVLGSLVALFFLVMAIGEGMPLPSHADVRGAFVFLGFCLMVAGLVLAWIWEAWGALCTLAGYAMLPLGAPGAARNPFFLGVAALALLHILCWLRLHAGGKQR
jgi:serine/threonine protein kinase/WD40 repeat protein